MNVPDCFDEETWKEWKDLALHSKLDPLYYCRDCSQAYKDKMMASNRCSHPETVFGVCVSTKDGVQEREKCGFSHWNPNMSIEKFYYSMNRKDINGTLDRPLSEEPRRYP